MLVHFRSWARHTHTHPLHFQCRTIAIVIFINVTSFFILHRGTKNKTGKQRIIRILKIPSDGDQEAKNSFVHSQCAVSGKKEHTERAICKQLPMLHPNGHQNLHHKLNACAIFHLIRCPIFPLSLFHSRHRLDECVSVWAEVVIFYLDQMEH